MEEGRGGYKEIHIVVQGQIESEKHTTYKIIAEGYRARGKGGNKEKQLCEVNELIYIIILHSNDISSPTFSANSNMIG